jgi:hypothetical protein
LTAHDEAIHVFALQRPQRLDDLELLIAHDVGVE